VKNLIIFFVFIFLVNTQFAFGQNIPSFMEIAEKRTKPGASPTCAPHIMDNGTAFEVLKPFKKIGYDYYLFATEKEWEKIEYNERWRVLAIAVSAMQSLYGDNCDVYLAVTPKTEMDKLMLGLNPTMDRIKGHAKYIYRVPKNLFGSKTERFPARHHERLYNLIVY
jgi:hypothetical protein